MSTYQKSYQQSVRYTGCYFVWLVLKTNKKHNESACGMRAHVCMCACVCMCICLSEYACSSGNNVDSRVSDQLLWLIWPVSVNHFCHLIDVTPVWKMSTTLTGRRLGHMLKTLTNSLQLVAWRWTPQGKHKRGQPRDTWSWSLGRDVTEHASPLMENRGLQCVVMGKFLWKLPGPPQALRVPCERWFHAEGGQWWGTLVEVFWATPGTKSPEWARVSCWMWVVVGNSCGSFLGHPSHCKSPEWVRVSWWRCCFCL